MNNLEALERIKNEYWWDRERQKDFDDVKQALEVLEILKEHFYETYVMGNGKISYLFRLNQNQENEKVKLYFERK